MTGSDIRETFASVDADREERILTFMEAMGQDLCPFLQQMEQEALRTGIPIIRTWTQSLIQFLLTLQKPARILEIGTATGFSALFMLSCAPASACLLSLEKDPERYSKALENREAAVQAGILSRPDRCEFRLADAAELLPQLDEGWDFIFLDAAKGQYIHFLPELVRVLSPGGILLSDNIFKDGEILESKFAVRRRDRTIYKRMREYLTALTHHTQLQTLLLQEGDGAAVSVKRTGESSGQKSGD